MKKKDKAEKIRNHSILDHPIPGYFILFIYAELFTGIIGALDNTLSFIPGYELLATVEIGDQTYESNGAMGIFCAIGALISLLIFKRWFQGSFEGSLVKKNLLTGLIIAAPFVALHVTGSIISLFQFGATEYVFASFLRCLCPAFSEEITFRGLGISNYMRTIRSEKQIMTIFLLSGISFGLIHVLNSLAGADLGLSIIQAIYAGGVGLLFGAIFLRTGNLWPTIIAHGIVDFVELCRADLSATGGVISSFCPGDWITIAVGILGGIFSFYLIRKEKRNEIMKLWAEKWHRNLSE